MSDQNIGVLARLFGGFTNSVTSDLSGRFVEVETIIGGSIIASLLQLGADIDLNRFLQTRNAPGGPPALDEAGNIDSENPVRGNYLGACVANALRDGTIENAFTPKEPPAVVNRDSVFLANDPANNPGAVQIPIRSP